jgi:hypothetical protein
VGVELGGGALPLRVGTAGAVPAGVPVAAVEAPALDAVWGRTSSRAGGALVGSGGTVGAGAVEGARGSSIVRGAG